MMTASERLEIERRELLRRARYEAFALRTIEINRKLQEEQERVLRARRPRQLVLEYVI